MASKIKNVVKVMNFHALIRVENAKRRAKRYQQMEDEVYHMMDLIMNNRNLILDKNILKPRADKPTLTIYLGSDLGFCSNYNSLINGELDKNPAGDKILIGKKLKRSVEDVLLRIDQDEFEKRIAEVEAILRESIRKKKHSSIHVVYNRYVNSTEICLESRQIYPFEMKAEADPANYRDDFLIDGDVEDLLTELATTYLAYEIRITGIFRLCIGKYHETEYDQRVAEEDRGAGGRGIDGRAQGAPPAGIFQDHRELLEDEGEEWRRIEDE